MNIVKAQIVLLVFTSFFVSCDKVSKVVNDWKNGGGKLSVSDEEIVQSDAAVMRYITLMEKVPVILTAVRDEETAFEARSKIDTLAREVEEIVTDLVPIEGGEKKKMFQAKAKLAAPQGGETERSQDQTTRGKQEAPDIQGGVYWYVLKGNEQKYEDQIKKIASRIVSQIIRIERITRDSAIAFDVVTDGILTLASIESGGKAPSENPTENLKPMPKDWLPQGVTRE